ncbi:Ser/Thr protein kinase RdoA involved in Cpx stress response, MazF antagonist [Paenibacillus polysaccharolyticus]|uniref:Ser/Thr protein kinase RdoA involved in Cpx stress response, MazF antagonist n=1 Tax=Paenibacillus polysaccharolyticus TaxID=582692 RepID=A0A1G5BHB6_9BACL|nr:aminoglycoside phosphotransferase family protein [Paenibacillus polysaccharolyticus]SCX89489.1 Ser/Thr protein kinase RdoA involved in Cpx stress response, MazF antagonist [Paenibacillus polysaccharolyticus]
MIQLSSIRWVQLDEAIRQGIGQEHRMIPLKPGLEADVMRVELHDQLYVLKIWNKDSRPDIRKQYQLLHELSQSGIQVSKPYGWGTDEHQNQVLLTSYDGVPVTRLDHGILRRLAQTLNDIHQHTVRVKEPQRKEAKQDYIPHYNFIDYFFPQVAKHQDIHHIVHDLMKRIKVRQDHFIHGDYNLGNILEMNGKYTVIDWTNGQYGDPRYDAAWSVFLITIYNERELGMFYQTELRALAGDTLDEEEGFEALAWLRWVLLSREGHVPRNSEVMRRVLNIAVRNPYLQADLL